MLKYCENYCDPYNSQSKVEYMKNFSQVHDIITKANDD